jgi:hypothetical protein
MQGADFHLNQWLMTSRTPVRKMNHTTESGADVCGRTQRINGSKGDCYPESDGKAFDRIRQLRLHAINS